MGKGGRMPQRKRTGASRRREKHRRNGFSDGSGSDDSAGKVAVKYQCIGADGEGNTSGGSMMVDQRQRVVTSTVTRAVEALRLAVSLTRHGGPREAIKSWRESNRCHKIARMTAELIHGYSGCSSALSPVIPRSAAGTVCITQSNSKSVWTMLLRFGYVFSKRS